MRYRYLTIEVLKGLGIFILIICHHVAWLLVDVGVAGLRYPGSEGIFDLVVNIVFTLGLPFWGFFLPLLAGASSYYYIQKESVNGLIVFRRVVGLIVLGFFMNYFTWGLYDIFDWDVLPFIGLSLLVSYPFVKRSRSLKGMVPLFVLAVLCLMFSRTFPLRNFQDYYLYKIIFGDVAGYHYWPFMPWYFLFCTGLFVGYCFKRKKKRIIRYLPVMGILLFMVAFMNDGIAPVVDLKRIWGPAVFKPTPYYLVAVMAFAFVTIGTMEWLFKKSDGLKDYFERSCWVLYGQHILWIYIFSTIMGYRLTLATAFFCNNIFEAFFVLPFIVTINLWISLFIARTLSEKKGIYYKLLLKESA